MEFLSVEFPFGIDPVHPARSRYGPHPVPVRVSVSALPGRRASCARAAFCVATDVPHPLEQERRPGLVHCGGDPFLFCFHLLARTVQMLYRTEVRTWLTLRANCSRSEQPFAREYEHSQNASR